MESIQDMYDNIRDILVDWTGEYYLHSTEGSKGVQIGGNNTYPQEINIEILSEEHPDTTEMELQLRRIIEGTQWKLSDDMFFEKEYPDACEIFIHREIDPNEVDNLLASEFSESEKI